MEKVSVSLHSAANLTAILDSSTYQIFSSWWDTSIAMSTLFSTFVLVYLVIIVAYLFRNRYADINNRIPIIRPLAIVLCVITAIVTGWIIEAFARIGEDTQLTYFTLSVNPLIGRLALESVAHNEFLYKGFIFVLGMHVLGATIGTVLGLLTIKIVGQKEKPNQFGIASTFQSVPLKPTTHLIKLCIVWLFFGATVPFSGYLLYVTTQNGELLFSPFLIILMTLCIVFLALMLTKDIGFYDGSSYFSFLLQLTNIFIIKNPNKKLILMNMPASLIIPVLFPTIFGCIYGALIYVQSI